MGETWAFDVDGTLIGSNRADRLRPGAGDLLTELAARGVSLVLWSAGGADYAERMAVRHRIRDHFVAVYAKVERDEHGRYVTDHLAPEHHPTTFVDDVPADMPLGRRVIAVPPFFGGNDFDRGLHAVLDDLDRHLPVA